MPTATVTEWESTHIGMCAGHVDGELAEIVWDGVEYGLAGVRLTAHSASGEMTELNMPWKSVRVMVEWWEDHRYDVVAARLRAGK